MHKQPIPRAGPRSGDFSIVMTAPIKKVYVQPTEIETT
jgi:hypothetical protein